MISKVINFEITDSGFHDLIDQFIGEEWADEWVDITIEGGPPYSRHVVFEATDPDRGIKRMSWTQMESEVFDVLHDTSALKFEGGEAVYDMGQIHPHEISELFLEVAFGG